MKNLKSCPNCKGEKLQDCYVFIKCLTCLMEGPKTNGGERNQHADFLDHENAIILWNNLPREKTS